MRQVIAEQLDQGTGEIVGARTLCGSAAECLLVGSDIGIGMIDLRNKCGRVNIRVSALGRDYQRARIYEDGQLVESLHYLGGTVVYVDESAARTKQHARIAAR